ncbi:MAG: T9SS type A sorting domain-containing protein, partial [Ignavibacteria bacterium]
KPGSFELLQNYPNPFNPATNIRFTLPSSGHVILKVYDILGKEAAVLINGYLAAGFHTSVFNGSSLSSGVYFYRIEFDNKINTKKMVFIK